MGGWELLILLIIASAYFVPSFIAFSRDKQNKVAILILNIFAGWTFLGWLIALIWSFTVDKK